MAEKIKNMGGGAQFEVAHDKEKVYKKPRTNILMFLYGKADYSQIKRDINKIQTIFPDYYLDTEVNKISENDYFLVQEYIKNGKELGIVLDIKEKADLQELWNRNIDLITKYGKSLDFLGNKGNITGLKEILNGHFKDISISNIMVIDGNLKIIDLDLLDLHLDEDSHNPIHILVDNISFRLSKFFLYKVYGIK